MYAHILSTYSHNVHHNNKNGSFWRKFDSGVGLVDVIYPPPPYFYHKKCIFKASFAISAGNKGLNSLETSHMIVKYVADTSNGLD